VLTSGTAARPFRDPLRWLGSSRFAELANRETLAILGAALLVLVAFWRSFAALLPLLGVDALAGLAPVIPALALWAAVGTARARRAQGKPLTAVRVPAVDIPLAAVLIGVAAWLMLRSSVEDGWGFWADRLDLLAAALFTMGLVSLLFGSRSLLYYKLATVLTVLLWPEPLVRIQSAVAYPLALFTAEMSRPIATAAGVAMQPRGVDPAVFMGSGAEQWFIYIGEVCSGLNATMAVPLVALPAVVWLRIPWTKAAPWLLAGTALAFASNIVRVVLLFIAADQLGVGTALGVIHPVLGAILMTLVFGVLWYFAPTQPRGVSAATHYTPAPFKAKLADRSLLASLALMAVFAVASTRLSAFETLPPLGPPGRPVSEPLEYLQLPSNWTLRGLSEIGWQNLFGADSRSYALSAVSDQGTVVKAQFITTPDRGRLRAFDLEDCRIFHGDDVVGRKRLDLNGGGTAYLVDTRGTGANGRLSVIYWEAPFSVSGREIYARMALFMVEVDEGSVPQEGIQAGIAPGGPDFDASDTILVRLADEMTRGVLAVS
jgi:exosortase/archaeosortase family protein